MPDNKNKGQGSQFQGSQNRPAPTGQGGQSHGGAGQMAKDAASSVSQAAQSVMATATEQAQHAAAGVASGMKTLAGTIREQVPGQGMLGTAAGNVAEGLESGSRYLQEEGFSGMAEDMVGMVRRNPIPCVLACVGVGFVLGLVLTSSSNARSY